MSRPPSSAGRFAALLLAILLSGCAPRPNPPVYGISAAAAARIRMVCPGGPFIGTMTADCPRIVE